MARPDPAFLDQERYPHVVELTARFGDLDVNMHVNNVAIMAMLEEVRVRFHRTTEYRTAIDGGGSVVAGISADFLDETLYPDPITFHTACETVGRSSHTLVQLARQGDKPIVFARSTIVATHDGKPRPLGDAFRAAVADWMLRA